MHELVTILILPAVDGEIVDWTVKKEAHFVWCKIYYCGKHLHDSIIWLRGDV